MFHKSIKGFCCILLIASLVACSGAPSKKEFKAARNQQQYELASLLETLWQRAHVIPTLQQGAPLISTAKAGQDAINQQNQHNIALVRTELAKLDAELKERKRQPETGDMAQLMALSIQDGGQTTYRAEPLILYRGEQSRWRLLSEQGAEVWLNVIWNEQGTLYMEGQDIEDLSPSSPDTPRVFQVFYYGGKVLAQAALTIELQTKVPRL
ncbi:hypothetical protein MAQ5080_03167 [Marinomonas aquimarina]|uniref:Lipoprotein n=1 Tax=Marinomonas aquimarina TaxID=295068 RepID=A0A1A8TQK9_9GAMM|nr:hypothetical protein [Marinomonas aquimarina]SBS35415.1 hypothetical protein MAQ5080_03167 [Marinomonas aquimarina]